MLDKDSVIKALQPVMDPELRMSIVDLGMVKRVEVDRENIFVQIALTVPGCPLVSQIEADIKKALGEESIVTVEFVTMSEEELENVREKIRLNSQNQKKGKDEPKSIISGEAKQSVTGISKLEKKGIRNIIAIASGKGGVGKSFVTSIIASEMSKRGYLIGILDADVTGPSIAKVFGLNQRLKGGPQGIIPAETSLGIKVISMNLVLENPEEALVWRGPILNSVIRQMYTDVDWGDLHFLLIDLPPGTSDAPLTVYQSMPINGAVIVTTPQDLAVMIVKKAIRMAKTMNIPVLGLIENMGYFHCPNCKKQFDIFGESKGKENADLTSIPFLGKIPLDPDIPKLSDEGKIEEYVNSEVQSIVKRILANIKDRKQSDVQSISK